MNERGQGYIADMLIFAMMMTIACSLLAKAGPSDPLATSRRYASSLAQSTLLAFQHSTANGIGGFTYELEALGYGLNVSSIKGSTVRELNHKTLIQLLVEDALCNLRLEVVGYTPSKFKPAKGMDEKVHELMKNVLDRLIGERFGYRLVVRAKPIDLSPSVKLYFESEIADLDGGELEQLCSEGVEMSLPISQEELIGRVAGVDISEFELEPEVTVEITLELWSK
jgi:hypothetical protein